MVVNKKMIVKNWVLIIVSMLIGFFVICLGIIINGNGLTNTTIHSFYEYNLSDKKAMLKLEVDNRIDEIEYERVHIVDEEKVVIKTKINNIAKHLAEHFTSGNDYTTNQVIKEYEQMVKDDEYLYFAINMNGELIRSGTDENLVGKSLMDVADIEGNYYVREMLKAKDQGEGVYVEYYWPKVKNGQPLKKVSYCLYIPQFDIIIGTGSYYDDISNRLQKIIYDRFQSYYKDKDNYLFIHEYDSTVRVSGLQDLIGIKVETREDINGNSIHKDVMELINTDRQGYLQYRFIDKDNDQLREKISYMVDLPFWQAYIGTGFYIDDLNKKVDLFNNQYKSYFYTEVLFIITGLVLLTLIVVALFQKGIYLQKKYMEQEDVVFEKLFDYAHEAILAISPSNEIIYYNEKAKEIFGNNFSQFISSGSLLLESVSNNVYLINNDSQRFYVEIKEETLMFKGRGSKIYFIEDISLNYIQTHELMQLAFIDPLTELPNRRALKEYFQKIKRDKINYTYVIGMIDIDNFKTVNDVYGHSTGDEVLKLLAQSFKNRLRAYDNIYRYGGEEFLILLESIDIQIAKKVVEEINQKFCTHVFSEFGFETTFSGGLVAFTMESHLSFDEAINHADELLYQAKRNGRNRVEIASDLISDLSHLT